MKTITVKIALIVSGSGKWAAAGWDGADDDELMGVNSDGVDDFPQNEFWIEAEVPVPEIKVISTKAHKANTRSKPE